MVKWSAGASFLASPPLPAKTLQSLSRLRKGYIGSIGLNQGLSDVRQPAPPSLFVMAEPFCHDLAFSRFQLAQSLCVQVAKRAIKTTTDMCIRTKGRSSVDTRPFFSWPSNFLLTLFYFWLCRLLALISKHPLYTLRYRPAGTDRGPP